MANNSERWGCCNIEKGNIQGDKNQTKCADCGKSYHNSCLSQKSSPNTPGENKAWICPSCRNIRAMRNVSTQRGNKKSANRPPSSTSPLNNKEEIRHMIQEIIKSEFSDMLAQFKESIITTMNKELEPIRDEIKDIIKSMSFINDKFDEFEKKQQKCDEIILKLQLENTEIKNQVGDLQLRINNMEQHSRSNNIEVQCMPENKNENVYGIISQLAQVVKCDLNEKNILYCSRVAKSNPSNKRPRSIVVQLASPRIRDQLIASVTKFNHDNPQNKLNCAHLGFSGQKSPVYIVEHLSPENKALHAAARIKAKEMGYKYVWVRNARIFVRKTDGAEYKVIKNVSCLSKIT